VAKSEDTKVTRISAKDTPTPKSAKTTKDKGIKAIAEPKQPKKARKGGNPIIKGLLSIGGYFKGAWFELRQVRWPTRRATWGLTLAVILFSAFFVVLILLLDFVFQYLFELILS